jgi:hypothetical protein
MDDKPVSKWEGKDSQNRDKQTSTRRERKRSREERMRRKWRNRKPGQIDITNEEQKAIRGRRRDAKSKGSSGILSFTV